MGPRLYRWLLGVLPRDFREEFGEELCRTVSEHWSEVENGLGLAGRGRFWVRQWLAVLRAAIDTRGGTGRPVRCPSELLHPMRV